VKRTLKLQLSPGTLLSVPNPDSGVTWKVKVLLLVEDQAVLPVLVFSGVALIAAMPVWLTYGVTLSAPVMVRLRAGQREPVGAAGVLTENVLGRAPVSVMTTVPVDPVQPEVRLEPDTITLQGVEAAVAEELVELQVTPPLATLVWERLATENALPLFWV
jgi:hypothetical protein